MEIKEILQKNQFRFNKRYGQNFISDGNLLSSIAGLANATGTVVEIGAGAGTLTAALAKSAKRVVAYEIDENLRPILAETLLGCPNVELRFKDIMRENISSLDSELGSFSVVANLPYYITTPVLMLFIEHSNKVESLTIMVQEEVARRLAAKENTPDYGSITAAIGFYGSAKIVKYVNRKMFYPVPNVDSAVVKIDIDRNKYDVSLEAYAKIVKCAFLSRRKTFVNNLMMGLKLSRAEAEELLSSSGIDLMARGETLSVGQFVELSKKIEKK